MKLYQFYVLGTDGTGIHGTALNQVWVTAENWFEGLKKSRVVLNGEQFRQFKKRYWYLMKPLKRNNLYEGNGDIFRSLTQAMLEIFNKQCLIDSEEIIGGIIFKRADALLKQNK